MTKRQPRDVESIIRAVEPRIHQVAERRDARVTLDMDARTDLAAEHIAEALQVALLVLAEHANPGGTFRVKAEDREGGDVEVVVTGLTLPADFPEGILHPDLWALAMRFLEFHHRVRVAHDEERVLLLVPHGDRAAWLRRRG